MVILGVLNCLTSYPGYRGALVPIICTCARHPTWTYYIQEQNEAMMLICDCQGACWYSYFIYRRVKIRMATVLCMLTARYAKLWLAAGVCGVSEL